VLDLALSQLALTQYSEDATLTKNNAAENSGPRVAERINNKVGIPA
jgi:hypothetical protein